MIFRRYLALGSIGPLLTFEGGAEARHADIQPRRRGRASASGMTVRRTCHLNFIKGVYEAVLGAVSHPSRPSEKV